MLPDIHNKSEAPMEALESGEPPRFVSFAQNLEDVVLWRALRWLQQGFYIDIGAAHPVRDSVTCAFYERGWRGINVEPAPTAFQALSAARSEDVNLQCLVGSESGVAPFFLIDGGGGFSTMDVQIARAHERAGMTSREISVSVMTLTDICSRYVFGPVHFLKVDVEGAEEAVLRGADLGKWRPWIVLMEATYPNTTDPSHAMWEPMLIEEGYRYVYGDGLNRFYVAAEHFDRLAPLLDRPPSPVLDWYISAAEADARRQKVIQVRKLTELTELMAAAERAARAELRRKTDQLSHQVKQLGELMTDSEQSLSDMRSKAEQSLLEMRSKAEQSLLEMRSKAERAEEQCRALLSSSSWRLTAPLRRIVNLARGRPFG